MSDYITVTGNVVTEPEQREIPGGVPVTTFRLASTHRRQDAQGAWVDGATNWYAVSVYRSLGDNAARSLRKGDRVVVQGRLRVKEWDNGNGKSKDVEIDADSLGHDLRWGTTTFHRNSRPASVADGAAAEGGAQGSDTWPTVSIPPEWATPGADGGEASAPRGDGAPRAELATVAAGGERPGADSGAPADAETPF